MSVDRYLAGIGLLALVTVPLGVAAVALRSRFLPTWYGARARVAEIVLVLGALTLTAQLLGIAGIFERWTLVIAAMGVGVAGRAFAHRLGPPSPETADPSASESQDAPDRFRRVATVVALLGAALVLMQWLAPALEASHSGMGRSVDTIWYHGPMAARFAETGSITAVHYFDDNPVTAYFPGGSALLHASGIVLFGDDVLSPLLNLGFLALAMLAAWVIGERFDAAPVSLLGAVVVLGTPALVGTQPGSEYNDVVGLAFVLASVALLVHSRARGPGLLIAAIAAGMAVGVKLTMLAPVGALTLGIVVVAGRGRRLRATAMWVAALGALGGVWYVRNLVVAGSPLPGLEASLGPISLPKLPTSTPIDDVAHYLTDWSIVRDFYVPGLDSALGPGWWAILLAAIGGGLAVVVRGRDPVVRMVGAAAVVGFVGFLFSPQYLGEPGLPVFFGQNVRYAATALVMGLAVLPALGMRGSPVRRQAMLIGFAAILALTQVRGGDLWPASATSTGAAIGLVGVGTVVVWFVQTDRARARRSLVAICATAVVGLVAGAWFVQRDYLELRYTDAELFNRPVLAKLRDQRDVRIATQGYFLQYPFYGPDLSNHVQYLGRRGPNGAWASHRSCAGWKRAINDGDYDYVLVAADGYPRTASEPLRALAWARSDLSGLREVARDGDDATLYRVVGRLDPRTCPEGADG